MCSDVCSLYVFKNLVTLQPDVTGTALVESQIKIDASDTLLISSSKCLPLRVMFRISGVVGFCAPVQILPTGPLVYMR
jgi:hypothetical protein